MINQIIKDRTELKKCEAGMKRVKRHMKTGMAGKLIITMSSIQWKSQKPSSSNWANATLQCMRVERCASKVLMQSLAKCQKQFNQTSRQTWQTLHCSACGKMQC